MRQIPLPLVGDEKSHELIITSCNQSAFNRIFELENDVKNRILLLGDDHSGKNLMGRYFLQKDKGIFIPNADKMSDKDLFFSWNKAHEKGCALLMSAAHEPSLWSIKLPDLKSRIASMELLQILPPDDELIKELIVRTLIQNDIAIGNKALNYVQKRIERDYNSLHKFIENCIIIAKENNESIKIKHIKSLLNNDSQ